jgi:hypothetical protein
MERDHWEDQGVGGWTLLKWILGRYDGVVWIGLIWLRIRDQWRAAVNIVKNLRVP